MASESDYTPHPQFESGSLILIFGQSQSGKSSWLTQAIIEHKAHWKQKIKRLIYIYKEDDANSAKLKKHFKNGIFLKSIPDDLEDMVEPSCTLVVFDDFQIDLSSKRNVKMLKKWGTIKLHHDDFCCAITLQNYDVFYKRNELNFLLYQTSSLVLFRSLNNFCALKRFLNAYEIRLKENDTLYDVFKKFVQSKPYSHLIINLSPKLKSPQVYSQVLFNDDRPLLIFHEDC